MLPIFGLFGLALAAALWPDTSAETEESASDNTADGIKSSDPETADILNAADAAPIGPLEAHHDDLIHAVVDTQLAGTDETDVLQGSDDADRISGGPGGDTLFGGGGDDVLYGDDDAEGDALLGGDGNDIIYAGLGDHVTGGSGDDEVHLDADGPVFIADYSPDDDKIILEYDPSAPAPLLETRDVADGIGLFADEQHVATFGGIAVLNVKDVHLVPEVA